MLDQKLSLLVCVCVRHRELLHSTVVMDHDGCRGADGRGGEGARTQALVSSVGEDRAILLGFTMMAFAALMFFVVGITVVKPYVNRYTVGLLY